MDESNNSNRQANSTRIVNTCTITYSVERTPQKHGESLVDRGANGGLAGTDMRVIATSPYRSVHVKGIGNHHVRDVPLVTAGGVLSTTNGDVIGIFHQYAHVNMGNSVHSSVQLEAHMNDVNDRSLRTPGGRQRILTVSGHEIPLVIRNGLPYFRIRPFTDREFSVLPHVVMTSNSAWNPSILDHDPHDVTRSTHVHHLEGNVETPFLSDSLKARVEFATGKIVSAATPENRSDDPVPEEEFDGDPGKPKAYPRDVIADNEEAALNLIDYSALIGRTTPLTVVRIEHREWGVCTCS
ncbi:MAG: hypothetical protein ACRCT2_01875, partial [Plesiomonas shigelloides]